MRDALTQPVPSLPITPTVSMEELPLPPPLPKPSPKLEHCPTARNLERSIRENDCSFTKPSQHSTPELSEATPGCSRQPTCPPASKALLSTMPGPGPRIQGQKLPPSVPHLAPSPCPNQDPGRFAGPQTSSSLALGLRSSLRTHLAPLVGNPLVSDLTGPQVTSRAWTGFGPQLYPHPHLGPVAW